MKLTAIQTRALNKMKVDEWLCARDIREGQVTMEALAKKKAIVHMGTRTSDGVEFYVRRK